MVSLFSADSAQEKFAQLSEFNFPSRNDSNSRLKERSHLPPIEAFGTPLPDRYLFSHNVSKPVPSDRHNGTSTPEILVESSARKSPSYDPPNTGKYTCTYHGCTLRFETPAKLQRHKREDHRNSASVVSTPSDQGM